MKRSSGPRSDINAREALVDAAEEAFASAGVDGTSIRSVATAAGLGVGMVHYHFGSKDELVRAVVDRRGLGLVEACRVRLLEFLVGSETTVPGLVAAMCDPYFELIAAQGKPALRWLKINSLLMMQRDPSWERLSTEVGDPPVADLLSLGLARVFPDMPEVRRREVILMAMATVVLSIGNLDTPALPAGLTEDGVDPVFADDLRAYTAAGLAAIAARSDQIPTEVERARSGRRGVGRSGAGATSGLADHRTGPPGG